MDWVKLVAWGGIALIVLVVFFVSVIPWLAQPPKRRKDEEDV